MLLAAVAHERLLRGGSAEEVRALAASALDGGLIAEQTGDSGLVMDAGFALAMAGGFDRADRAWAEALADVRRRGSVIGFARTSCMRALLRLQQGRLADAESDARNAVEAAWEPGYRIARMAHAPLVEALVAQGELDAADAALAAAGLDGEIPDGYMLNFVLFARGALRLAQGRGSADLEELAGARANGAGAARRCSRTARCSRCTAGPSWPRRRCELARARGAAGPLGARSARLGLVRGDLRPPPREPGHAGRIAVAARARPHARRARRRAAPGRPPARLARAAACGHGARARLRRRSARRPRARGAPRDRRASAARGTKRRGRADGERAEGRADGGRRDDEPADRAGPLRHHPDRRGPPHARLPEARHLERARSFCPALTAKLS